MFRKSVVILSFDKKDAEVVQFVKKEVEKLNLRFTSETFHKELPPPEEVEVILKKYYSVLVLGATEGIVDLFSTVFNQEVVHYEDQLNYGMLANVKVLKNNQCSVFHLQGVLFLVDSFRRSMTEVVLPYLANLTKEPVYKRKLVAKNLENSNGPQISEDLNCDFNDRNLKINFSSKDLHHLLYFEKQLREKAQLEIVSICNGENLDDLVYCLREEYIKNSIQCIEACFEKYGPENVFVSFNGGKDCTVLLHLTLAVLKRNYPERPNQAFCVYVENSNPFPELNDFIEDCQSYYDLDLLRLQKSMKESLQFVLDSRPNMKACLMGTRRTDPHSGDLEAFQMTDPDWPQLMRVSPILEWHYSDIWDYLLQLHVPYCNLYDLGYTSLGSSINTIKNPLLLKDDAKLTHFPAYKLFDEMNERNGRNVYRN